jgi:hypothetical protein
VNRKHVVEITAKAAAERLQVNRRSVLKMIARNALTARLVTEAPRPYWLVAVDAKFLSEEKRRTQAQA